MVVGASYLLSHSQQVTDLGVTAILNPVPNTNVPNNFNDTLKFTIQNFGMTTISSGDTIPLSIEVDGLIAIPVLLGIDSDFPPMAQANVDLVGIDLGAMGLPNGNHTVCISTAMPGDVDPANDSTCATYTLVDPTVIFESSNNWENIQVYFANDRLHFNVTHLEIEGRASISVYSVLGQEVFSGQLGANGHIAMSINVSDQPKGVYIVRIVSNGKLIDTRKVMKN